MLTLSAKTSSPYFVDIENRAVTDQLLVLLSDNQVFLNKVQKAQWNFGLFSQEQYDFTINLLFNSAEKIAAHLKAYKGFIPADMELYLSLSDIEEDLSLRSRSHMIEDLLMSHKTLVDYLVSFSEDKDWEIMADQNENKKEELVSYLNKGHLKLFHLLEEFSR